MRYAKKQVYNSSRKLLSNQLVRFFLVFVSNTLTFIVVLVFLKYNEVSDTLANLTGYLVANIQSYILNKIWTFQNKEKVEKTFLLYLSVILIAYLINLLTLLLALHYLHMNSYFAHGVAGLAYGGTAFLGMRYLVFKKK